MVNHHQSTIWDNIFSFFPTIQVANPSFSPRRRDPSTKHQIDGVRRGLRALIGIKRSSYHVLPSYQVILRIVASSTQGAAKKS